MLACIWRWWKNEPSWGRDLLPTLVDQTGRFPRTSGEFIRRAILGGISWDEVEREIAAQIARF